MIGALAISASVGVGVYVVIKQQREASASERATSVEEPPAPAPPTDPPPPVPVPETAADVPPVPADRAEAAAVDPEPTEGPPPTNAPQFGTPGIEGGLDQEAVVAAVAPTAPKLQKCLEPRYPKDGARIGGTLRVTLQVNRRGGVTEATSVGPDDTLGTCVASVLKDVRFARTSDGGTAKVVYPIAFHNAHGTNDLDDACDEVSCVLENYEPACCARFRRGAQPSTASTPESITRDELSTALKALKSNVTACAYAQELTGTFKVRFKVAPDGTVSTVTIADAEPAFTACVTRAFKSHKFSVSQNGVAASFPFIVQ